MWSESDFIEEEKEEVKNEEEKSGVSQVKLPKAELQRLIKEKRASLVEVGWTKSEAWNNYKCIEHGGEVSYYPNWIVTS